MDSAALTQAQWQQYQQNYAPMNKRLMELADDTSIIDAARKRTTGLAERSSQQIDLVTGRRLSSMSPAQRRSIRDRLASQTSTDTAATMQTATVAQRDVRQAAMNGSLDIAGALNNQALASLSQVDAMKAQRDAQNAANKKAAKGGFMSTLGTVAGSVIGAFVGGPAGAAAGAQIGGSAGSMLGG